jgi:hypothetical protein
MQCQGAARAPLLQELLLQLQLHAPLHVARKEGVPLLLPRRRASAAAAGGGGGGGA